jgi:hypothetical protein
MSDSDDRSGSNGADPTEARLRGWLRIITAGMLILLVAILALADTFGRPAGLRVSDTIFFAIIGALITVLFGEGAAKFIRRP